MTALHVGVRNNCKSLILLLLQHKADVNTKDKVKRVFRSYGVEGRGLRFEAMMFGHIWFVEVT